MGSDFTLAAAGSAAQTRWRGVARSRAVYFAHSALSASSGMKHVRKPVP